MPGLAIAFSLLTRAQHPFPDSFLGSLILLCQFPFTPASGSQVYGNSITNQVA